MSCTLAAPASFEQQIQKSRFLARAWPVADADSAMAHVADCAREDASHHCWAWRIGQHYRFHDAAEPAGTAGRPILQAIDGQALDQVVAVVSRWFGGIKLGAGGLVRAYGGTAAECLRLAARRALIDYEEFLVGVPFASESALRQLLGELEGSLGEERYDSAGLRCRARLPRAAGECFANRLRDLCRGQATIAPWRE
ncbi:MAG: YigZ family protein [Xanthomonadales bacterium]|nr:IMPACT family member YigZ [Xanthomonadales bacterium]MCC6591977.1 YigZ family protein [Xanthomonadales bacterium]